MRNRVFLILLLLLVVSFPAAAALRSVLQVTAGAGAAYIGPGNAPATLGANADAFFGLRAFTTAIATAGTQKLINIIRASDSETCDVLVATTGGMGNTTSCSGADNGITASTFCNATTCKVTKWYDQSGSNDCTAAPCNISQATSGKQPSLIFNCINTSLPCVRFLNASSTDLQTTTTVNAGNNSAYIAFYVASRTGNTSAINAAWSTSSGSTIFNVSWTATANTVAVNSTTSNATNATATDSAFHAIAAYMGYNGSYAVASGSGMIAVDGAQGTNVGSLGTSTTGSPWSMGVNNTGTPGQFATMDIVEWWSVGGAGTVAADMTSICHNQRLYYGTPGSC